jgi:glutaconyl-CoA/methylmalonyl-CoA decarboxylase subunit delta
MKLLSTEWANALNVIGFTFLMVFLLLILVVLILNILGKLITSANRTSQVRIKKEANLITNSVSKNAGNQLFTDEISGEEIAAISMALYSCFSEEHDNESDVVTIRKTSKSYSPWSSKIYGLNVFH